MLEKLKHKKSGVGLSLLQKEFEKVRMTAEAGDADPTDAGPMQEEKATNDPARLIHILHDTMEAKIVADGKSHMVPLVPGEKGLAVVKWHGEILQTLVSNKTLPACRLLEMSPRQKIASPAGSSTYPLVEIMEAWEDEEPDQAPRCIKDEDMDQDAEGPDQAPQCMDQDAEGPDQDAEEPDQDAEEPDQDAAGADQDEEEADQDAELASDLNPAKRHPGSKPSASSDTMSENKGSNGRLHQSLQGFQERGGAEEASRKADINPVMRRILHARTVLACKNRSWRDWNCMEFHWIGIFNRFQVATGGTGGMARFRSLVSSLLHVAWRLSRFALFP